LKVISNAEKFCRYIIAAWGFTNVLMVDIYINTPVFSGAGDALSYPTYLKCVLKL